MARMRARQTFWAFGVQVDEQTYSDILSEVDNPDLDDIEVEGDDWYINLEEVDSGCW